MLPLGTDGVCSQVDSRCHLRVGLMGSVREEAPFSGLPRGIYHGSRATAGTSITCSHELGAMRGCGRGTEPFHHCCGPSQGEILLERKPHFVLAQPQGAGPAISLWSGHPQSSHLSLPPGHGCLGQQEPVAVTCGAPCWSPPRCLEGLAGLRPDRTTKSVLPKCGQVFGAFALPAPPKSASPRSARTPRHPPDETPRSPWGPLSGSPGWTLPPLQNPAEPTTAAVRHRFEGPGQQP